MQSILNTYHPLPSSPSQGLWGIQSAIFRGSLLCAPLLVKDSIRIFLGKSNSFQYFQILTLSWRHLLWITVSFGKSGWFGILILALTLYLLTLRWHFSSTNLKVCIGKKRVIALVSVGAGRGSSENISCNTFALSAVIKGYSPYSCAPCPQGKLHPSLASLGKEAFFISSAVNGQVYNLPL